MVPETSDHTRSTLEHWQHLSLGIVGTFRDWMWLRRVNHCVTVSWLSYHYMRNFDFHCFEYTARKYGISWIVGSGIIAALSTVFSVSRSALLKVITSRGIALSFLWGLMALYAISPDIKKKCIVGFTSPRKCIVGLIWFLPYSICSERGINQILPVITEAHIQYPNAPKLSIYFS